MKLGQSHCGMFIEENKKQKKKRRTFKQVDSTSQLRIISTLKLARHGTDGTRESLPDAIANLLSL